MEQHINNSIAAHGLLKKGDNVIVALSGGADSVALFHFFCSNAEALGIAVSAAHFEHGLRGEESQRDADFVCKLCESKGIKLYIEHGDMQNKPRPAGQSLEEWARKLRYAFLEKLAGEHNALVATAHTLNDNAETVLFHAARGAGPKGLGGIQPKRGVLIRPMLEVSRNEVEAYCKAKRLAFVQDSTNADVKYARNRLRMQVLPALEEVHHGAAAALGRMAGDMRQLDEYLTQQAHTLLSAAAVETSKDWSYSTGCFDPAALLAAPQPVRLQAFALLAGPHASRGVLARMEAVLRGERKSAQLGHKRQAKTTRQGFWVGFEQPAPEPPRYEEKLENRRYELPGGYAFFVETMPVGHFLTQKLHGMEKSNKKDLNFTADYDKISECSIVRTRRAGDHFAFAGRGVTKALKKWMNETGMDETTRAYLPLLAHGSRVLWIWGEGFCKGLAPDDTTKHVLRICCETNEE